MGLTERWPPVYDAEQLKEQIARLGRTGQLAEAFYGRKDEGGAVCQGDLIELTAALPFVDQSGEAAVEVEYTHWLILGNTCDFTRDQTEVRWSQMVPVVPVPDEAIRASEFHAVRVFGTSRKFYLPPWNRFDRAPLHGIADLTSMAAVDKRLLTQNARKIVTRMSLFGWVLMQSCILRFLGRDDGRFDD